MPTATAPPPAGVTPSIPRRDGRLKVAGAATFAAEWELDGCLFAVGVQGRDARGRITAIDTAAAEAAPGVVAVMTHRNRPALAAVGTYASGNGAAGSSVMPLESADLHHAGEWVAVVVAETLEAATYAAGLVGITVEPADADTAFPDAFDAALGEPAPKVAGMENPVTKGDAEAAFAAAAVQIDFAATGAKNHHNPIEPHASTADHRADAPAGEPVLTVRDTSQNINAFRDSLAHAFSLDPARVRVLSPFVGGAFGCKGNLWPHVFLAAAASKLVGRPVRFVCARQQLYGGIGFRPRNAQRVRLGADQDGHLLAQIHEGLTEINRGGDYVEAVTVATRHMYASEALLLDQRILPLDVQAPTFMRAPGETPGMAVTEAAMDALAYEVGLDPIELRRRNEPAVDPLHGTPFSSRLLLECFEKGGEAFGWGDRNPEPRATTDGRWRIGTGVAAATYHASYLPNAARLTLRADGTVSIASATHEMGTGTTTAQALVAAELLGLPVRRVRFDLGDTDFPRAAVSGGSMTTAGVGGAVRDASEKLGVQLFELARKAGLGGFAEGDAIAFTGGKLVRAGDDASGGVAFEEILEANHLGELKVDGAVKDPHPPFVPQETSNHSFGAQFAEVAVDEALGMIRVRRFTGCYACGRIVNAQTARSQFLGGVVMGLSHALHEHTVTDDRPGFGCVMNDNLAEYHVPVNADVPAIDVHWIATPDYAASPIGAKGVGEIGITGVSAAIANAVFHATGKRVRHTPILAEDVLA